MALIDKMKSGFIKFIEISLLMHGVLHFVEFGVAIYEEAYITAGLAAFGALTMVLGALFLNEGFHHHHHHKSEEE